MPPPSPTHHARLRAVAAAAAYLAVSLWALRVTLPAFDASYSNVVTPGLPKSVADGDQALMVWATSRNARVLLTHPTRLLDFEQNHPLSRAAGLGHPLYADGIMAIPFWLLGVDPIPLLNVSSVLVLWLSALTMFFLGRYWTGSDAAAFVAGLAFGFHPFRILGAHWPGIVGNQWSPLILLVAHRLFARGGWGDATALAGLVALQVLGSIYQLIPFALMGVAYALWAAARHRRRLVALAPKLLLVVAVGGAAAVVQLSAYLDLKAAWGLGGRIGWRLPLSDFLPGARSNPGSTVLVLALLGLADRLRGPRTQPAGEDPRLVCLLMGFLALWLLALWIPIPGIPWVIPSLLTILEGVVPNLDALRIINAGRLAVYLPAALLAAYGVVAVTERGGRVRRAAVGALVACCLLAEVFVPALARRSFATDGELEAQPLPPPSPELRALFGATLEGAVLDVPPCYGLGFACRAHSLLLAAYHEHPIAWGWGSHLSPLAEPIERLADRLPAPDAADALYALGFRSVVLHGERLGGRPHPLAQVAPSPQGRLTPLGRAAEHAVYRLDSPVPVTADFTALGPVPSPTEQPMTTPGTSVVFELLNATPTTYRHPDPIEPSDLSVRWVTTSGEVLGQQEARALLPLALAAGARESLTLALAPAPADGECLAVLTLARSPTRPLAIARVRLARPSRVEPAGRPPGALPNPQGP